MGEYVLRRMRDANALVHRAAPYVLLEILLPGGTLFALLLFVYRRSHSGTGARGRHRIGLGWMLARMEDALDLRVAGGSRGDGRDGLEPLGLAPET